MTPDDDVAAEQRRLAAEAEQAEFRALFGTLDDTPAAERDEWADRPMSDDERDALAEGYCVVAWIDEYGDLQTMRGDDGEVWRHVAAELPPYLPVWVNGYRITR